MPEFFKLISNHDIFILLETFLEEGKELPYLKYFENFKIDCIPAIRNNRLGRASGGIMCGVKTTSNNNQVKFKKNRNNIIIDITFDSKNLQIAPIYLNFTEWNRKYDELYNFLVNQNHPNLMVIGDLNGRISDFQNSILVDNDHFTSERKSSDGNLNTKGKGLINLIQDFGFFLLNGVSRSDNSGNYTFVSDQGCSVIDYCLVRGEWLKFVEDFEVYPANYSSHLPIIVSCKYRNWYPQTSSNVCTQNKLKWVQNKSDIYQRKLSQQVVNIPNPSLSSVEEITNSILLSVRNSAVPGINSHVLSKSKWYDNECKKSRRKSFVLLKLFRRTNCMSVKNMYLRQNKIYKNLCAHKKEVYLKKAALKIAECRDSKSFWFNVRILSGSSKMRVANIDIDLLANHFENLLLRDPNQNSINFAFPNTVIPELDSEFSMFDLITALRKMKNNKASGSDGIPVEFFKNATSEFLELILVSFNKMFREEAIPKNFLSSRISAIFKKGDQDLPENYRGIAVLNSLRKVFTQILYNRLATWAEQNNIITCFQAGFRANLSTVDQIFVLNTLARRSIDKKKCLYAFFVDLKAAFDTVNRRSLLFKLAAIGISTKFIRVYEKLLESMTGVVQNGKYISRVFNCEIGVPQGCVLSPLIFALFINDVETYIPGGVVLGDLLIKVLLYADDMVILSEDPLTLQLQINKLKQYCDLWDLKINTSKSKIMVFRSQHRSINYDRNWTLDGEVIEIVNEFKYLGYVFTPNLSITAHIKQKSNKAKTAINTIWSKFFTNKYVDAITKFQVFNATINSCFCYGNEVYGYEKIDEIELVQRYFFKRIFKLPINTPSYAIHVESGLSPIFLKNLKANADYIVRVMKRSDNNLQKRILLICFQRQYTPIKNWYDLAITYNYAMSLTVQNVEDLRNAFYDCISLIDEKLYKFSLERARESTSRVTYRQLNHGLGENNYFKNELSVFEMGVIFKTRTEMLELNYRPHRGEIDPICSLCNLNQNEDIFHFLALCPILQEIRRLHFNSSYLTVEECIGVLNGNQGWKSLIGYVIHAKRYRNTYMNFF